MDTWVLGNRQIGFKSDIYVPERLRSSRHKDIWSMSAVIDRVALVANTDERKFLLEVIEMYRSLPALWYNKCKAYSNSTKKNEQYDELLQKYNNRYTEADRKGLIKKINSLRANFRKELRRIKKSERSGACSGEVVEPTLWYFHEMKFLTDLEEPTESVNIMIDEGEI
ncbi:hypothetical protein J6590_040100 [Homalodisca vitripennis]|nr:hypothetical protein J6590_040100 [Homalodisca vitripennis]